MWYTNNRKEIVWEYGVKKIKCPSCGGELNIPEDSDEIKCSFCGSKVIIDDKATEVGRIKKAEIKAKKNLMSMN